MANEVITGDILKTESEGSSIEYEILSVPSEVKLETVSYNGKSDLSSMNAFPVHHFYIQCNTLTEDIRLPLDANPRRPTDSPQVDEMQKTLGNEPENFVKKNNGMTVLCKEIEQDSGSIKFVFDEGEGICNGGHTYFAIQDYAHNISDEAVVHIEAIEIPSSLQGDERKKELGNISHARNNNNKLERRSQADFNELFQPYKDWMDDPQLVEWREGDTDSHYDALKAEHFIRLLKVMDPDSFYHPLYCTGCETHKTAATQKSSIFRQWMDKAEAARSSSSEHPFSNLLPLINDILWLRDMISESLKHDDDLIDRSGKTDTRIRSLSVWMNWIDSADRKLRTSGLSHEFGLSLPKPFEVMVLGLFRTNIAMLPDQNGKPTLIGWYFYPSNLWDEGKVSLLLKYNDYFKEADTDPNQFKRRVAPFEQNLYVLGTRQQPPDPQILYRKEDGQKFEKSTDSETTHWLDDENKMVEISSNSPSSTASQYIAIDDQ